MKTARIQVNKEMTAKPSIFVGVVCVECSNKISYIKVQEEDTVDIISSWPVCDQYCVACYEKQKKETEGMT